MADHRTPEQQTIKELREAIEAMLRATSPSTFGRDIYRRAFNALARSRGQ